MPPRTDDPRRRAARFDWDSSKLGLEPMDLWKTLYDRFNTQRTVIQDDEAFHHDVVETSKEAKNLEQFYSLLEERRSLRLKELNDAFRAISYGINHNTFGDEDRWDKYLRLCGFRSFDALVSFFDTYVAPEHWEKRERHRAEMTRKYGRTWLTPEPEYSTESSPEPTMTTIPTGSLSAEERAARKARIQEEFEHEKVRSPTLTPTPTVETLPSTPVSPSSPFASSTSSPPPKNPPSQAAPIVPPDLRKRKRGACEEDHPFAAKRHGSTRHASDANRGMEDKGPIAQHTSSDANSGMEDEAPIAQHTSSDANRGTEDEGPIAQLASPNTNRGKEDEGPIAQLASPNTNRGTEDQATIAQHRTEQHGSGHNVGNAHAELVSMDESHVTSAASKTR